MNTVYSLIKVVRGFKSLTTTTVYNLVGRLLGMCYEPVPVLLFRRWQHPC